MRPLIVLTLFRLSTAKKVSIQYLEPPNSERLLEIDTDYNPIQNPEANEALIAGNTTTIKWITTTAESDTQKFTLCRLNDKTYAKDVEINLSGPNTGSLSWKIQDTIRSGSKFVLLTNLKGISAEFNIVNPRDFVDNDPVEGSTSAVGSTVTLKDNNGTPPATATATGDIFTVTDGAGGTTPTYRDGEFYTSTGPEITSPIGSTSGSDKVGETGVPGQTFEDGYEHGSSATARVIGVAVGSSVGGILALLGVFYFVRRRRRKARAVELEGREAYNKPELHGAHIRPTAELPAGLAITMEMSAERDPAELSSETGSSAISAKKVAVVYHELPVER
ncbi:hypothetical protein OQA88_7375 [Cercophora sp. LCS_1]